MKQHTDDLGQRYEALRPCLDDITAALDIFVKAFTNGNKLLLCGNGGSQSDCDHIVGELMKGFMLSRPIDLEQQERLREIAGAEGERIASSLQGALPAIALSCHNALASAIANDIKGDMIFAQQLYGLGRPGDVLLAISTSGNSQNVLHACTVARLCEMQIVSLTGRDGGKLAETADVAIRVPATTVTQIQEFHLPVYHALCLALEEHFFGAA
jgi:D-sedoheptulose 7-phosphate isomerase